MTKVNSVSNNMIIIGDVKFGNAINGTLVNSLYANLISSSTYCNLPQATSNLAGIVQLANTYTNNSTLLAPTANALSNAWSTLSNMTLGVSSTASSTSNYLWGTLSNTVSSTSGIANATSNMVWGSLSNNVSSTTSIATATSNMVWGSLSNPVYSTSNYVYGTLATKNPGYWSTSNSVMFTSSNVGFGGKSNPIYPVDATGKIRSSVGVVTDTYGLNTGGFDGVAASNAFFFAQAPPAKNAFIAFDSMGTGGYSLGFDSSDSRFKIKSGSDFAIGTARFTIDSSGQFGFNTTTPCNLVDINGNATVRGNLTVNSNLIATSFCNLVQTYTSACNNIPAAGVALSNLWSTLSNQNLAINQTAVAASNKAYSVVSSQWTTSGANVYITGSNVSIGSSTNASAPLDVWGDAVVRGMITASCLNVLTLCNNFTVTNTDVRVTDQFTISNIGSGPALKVLQYGANSIAEFYDDANMAMKIHDTGKVGVGSAATPTEMFEVFGNTRVDSNLYVLCNLAVGTSSAPATKLDVVGDATVRGNISSSNVSVGSATSVNPLDVKGNSTISGILMVGGIRIVPTIPVQVIWTKQPIYNSNATYNIVYNGPKVLYGDTTPTTLMSLTSFTNYFDANTMFSVASSGSLSNNFGILNSSLTVCPGTTGSNATSTLSLWTWNSLEGTSNLINASAYVNYSFSNMASAQIVMNESLNGSITANVTAFGAALAYTSALSQQFLYAAPYTAQNKGFYGIINPLGMSSWTLSFNTTSVVSNGASKQCIHLFDTNIPVAATDYYANPPSSGVFMYIGCYWYNSQLAVKIFVNGVDKTPTLPATDGWGGNSTIGFAVPVKVTCDSNGLLRFYSKSVERFNVNIGLSYISPINKYVSFHNNFNLGFNEDALINSFMLQAGVV